MGGPVQASIVVGPRAVLTSGSYHALRELLKAEAAFWSLVFPKGIQSSLSCSLLRPNYSSLIELVGTYQFQYGPLQLLGRKDLAIYPASSSVEGRALLRYANTDLAFAILRFLWAEANWTGGSALGDSSDRVAEETGELLVLAFRLSASINVQRRLF
ncbi:MAG: hypothetical protein NTW20_06640 [Rhodobacterales bacterium]|nr:hypothetical protein [Rhodobacterales bacterium]